MNFDLNDEEQGLDINFESEAFILPHTIKPSQNDCFVINVLNKHHTYLFRITNIEYDNVHPDNFYKISFKLEATDPQTLINLEKQCFDNYICIINNIGTDESCIIHTDLYNKYLSVKNIYEDMVNTYLSIFYNYRYNTLLGEKPCSKKLYDPYLIEFVNKHGLFNDKEELKTFIFSQEIKDNRFRFKYEKSIYRFIERRDISFINNFRYYNIKGTDLRYSIFSLYNDESIDVLDIPIDYYDSDTKIILPDEFINDIKSNNKIDTDYGNMIKRYILKEELSLSNIPESLPETLYSLNASLEFFFITPIILYILKDVLKINMQDKVLNAVVNDDM